MKGYLLTASIKLTSLQRRMLRKSKMSQRVNPSLWKFQTQNQWQCQFNKMFPSPTPWRFKERRNKSPVRWVSISPKRKRQHLMRQSCFMRIRQSLLKRK
jgi:hypothetical protein